MEPLIYLDNSATTKIRAEVLEAMLPFLTDCWGNPSSIHAMGRSSRAAIERAREQVALMIGAEPSEIIFTSHATFSNNAAILGRARCIEQQGLGRHLITSRIEHPSALEPVKHLKARGWRITMLPVNREGFIDVDQLRAAIASDTSIISLMWANNEIGTIQPMQAMAEVAAEKGIFFHTDAVQAAGKIKIDLSSIQVHSLSLSGHKFHAPKGIGIHYLRKGTKTKPVNFGGGQEHGIAPGTENVANIIAIGKAAELVQAELPANVQRLRELATILRDKLLSVPQVKMTGARDLEKRVPGHLSVTVPGRIGTDLVRQADQEGICIASASACSSGASKISYVLRALGLSEEEASGALRISACILNSEDECRTAANLLARIISDSFESSAHRPVVNTGGSEEERLALSSQQGLSAV